MIETSKERELPPRPESITGLTNSEVEKQRAIYGSNRELRKGNLLLENLMMVVKEPMFLLLLAACLVYFMLSEFGEAMTMLAALLFVAGIDVFQNYRSKKAVKALNRLTQKRARVLRGGKVLEIPVEEVVVRDVIICEEGSLIPADAEILSSNDFSVNEALITGESVSVDRFVGETIVKGSYAVRGYCYARVSAVGDSTQLSGIGKLVDSSQNQETPLQGKVSRFVKLMVIAGSFAFAFVWVYYWWESGSIWQGLLHGLTMAMSVLPEEIPVALSTFMAIGAYRLLKHGVIARSPKTVEALGSATVICLDKTGTLTQNLMEVAHTFDPFSGKEVDFQKSPSANEILEYAMWGSEVEPFDPMEQSIHRWYSELFDEDKRPDFQMVKEFPLAGKPPVMTHVFRNGEGNTTVSCKGALEGVLKLCKVKSEVSTAALQKEKEFAKGGLRVLGVAKGIWSAEKLPELQEDIEFQFLGLIAFYDPPVSNIAEVIKGFYDAGVGVKMITGDYSETAAAIARMTGIQFDKVITGKEIEQMSGEELGALVNHYQIFARVSPGIKLRVIKALQKSGEIVAMTGDGVNDAPALKSAHIGVSMGKRGTEVARSVAGLVLSEDDLSKMISAIFLGRRINENLTQAIRYIISIHIPIILLVTLPIFFLWMPAMLFAPIHVIFLELIMGPTCSIIYENEPIEKDQLKKPSPAGNRALLTSSQIYTSVIQGLAITLGCVAAGWYANNQGFDDFGIRTYVFTTLILSNIFLTLVNRSFTKSILHTIRRKNSLIPLIISVSSLFLILILYTPLFNNLFKVIPLRPGDWIVPIVFSLITTMWLEVVLWWRRGGN